MAKMIPDIKVRKGALGEERLYLALKESLPDEYTVFHSLPFVSVEEGRGIYEHEIDFLVIHRELGFLDIEVKGGREIRYLQKRREWISVSHRGEEHVISRDPYRQASDNIHWLAREIVKRGVLEGGEERFPFTHGYAVAFPDATVDTRYFPMHTRKELTLDRSDLGRIYERVSGIMEQWRREGKSRVISEREYNDLCNKFLMPEFRVAASIAKRIEDEEAQLIRLTEEQCRLLDFLRNQKQALIQGYAGTGKTQLAVEKARRLAAEGKKVLLMCFNSPLARYLESVVGDEGGAITIDNYHNLCARMAEKAGIPFEVPPEEKKEERKRFWDRDCAAILEEALDRVDARFDAVIIDEGQDFREEWTRSVFKLLREGRDGCLYTFFDERQNIYRDELHFPIQGEPYVLHENCRNTQRICELAGDIGGVDPESYVYDKNPQGEEVRFKAYGRREDQPRIIADIVAGLLKKGVSPGQITVLSPHIREKSCMAGVEELAGCRVLDYSERMPADAVCFSSLKRFKGLESDVVIFCDMDGKFPIHNPLDQYVAVSRAKHLLYVVHDRDWKPPAG